jgi:hypothetical protein
MSACWFLRRNALLSVALAKRHEALRNRLQPPLHIFFWNFGIFHEKSRFSF